MNKQDAVSSIKSLASTATALFIADLTRVSSNQMNIIRAHARVEHITTKVVKHTLTKIGLAGTEFSCVSKVLKEKKILIFVSKDVSDSAKILKRIIDKADTLHITHVCFKNQVHTQDMFQTLLLLPTRKEALLQLVQACRAPIESLKGVLEQVPRNFISSLNGLKTLKSTQEE